jgi:hypothetical protein
VKDEPWFATKRDEEFTLVERLLAPFIRAFYRLRHPRGGDPGGLGERITIYGDDDE